VEERHEIKKILLILIFVAAFTLQSCGGSTPPPVTADDEPERPFTAAAGLVMWMVSVFIQPK
jgi:hypothetical protein